MSPEPEMTPQERLGDARQLGDLTRHYPIRRVTLTPELAREWLARALRLAT